ncbi:MAG: glycosyl transferase [Nocardioides sp.]|nr:glycosyl transferase [Nocardioides sp.]
MTKLSFLGPRDDSFVTDYPLTATPQSAPTDRPEPPGIVADMTTQTFREALAESPRVPGTGRHDAGGTAARFPALTWERVALAALLGGTGVLYLWGLDQSGWGNSFYAAAAQAGSQSWKAFFFGASDAANSITVDKTPLSLWPMGLSVRIFGLSSWSILVPQALEGVAAVALLHTAVRRTTGSAAAGLLAGAVLALTPVAVLMFRFDNPDALLVLLLIGSAYATQRAVEATVSTGSATEGSGRPVPWLALAGALVGLAFLTKMLQAFLVLPALALVYVLFAAVPLWKRFGHLLVAFGAMVLAGGWWVAIVELWPAASRPYIGGSQNNSILELTLGYNGLGRLTGNETGSVGGNWGQTGILRMFGAEVGSQIAWLLPTALILGVAGLCFARGLDRRGPRGGRPLQTGLTLWLGWLVATAVTFSFMAGIFHAYYTVALAPAIAALVAIGGLAVWRRRESLLAAGVLAGATAFTSTFAFALLARTDWMPWLKYLIVAVGLVTSLLIAGVGHLPTRVGQAVAATAVLVALAGPTAYSLSTAASAHTGAIPTAGPAGASTGGGPGGRPGGLPGGAPGGMTGRMPGGPAGGGPASTGGLLDGSTSSAELTALLQTDATSFTWVAAAVGSNSAAGYQLATGDPVMPVGGFNGSDPSPTLAQFQTDVANGEIHYFIGGGGRVGGGGAGLDSGTSSQISAWVTQNFTPITVAGVTVYDLSTGIV